MKYIYNNNLFIKSKNEKKYLLRIKNKELYIDKEKINYSLIEEIVTLTCESIDSKELETILRKTYSVYKIELHLKLLVKIKALSIVQDSYIVSPRNNYIIKNYPDGEGIIEKLDSTNDEFPNVIWIDRNDTSNIPNKYPFFIATKNLLTNYVFRVCTQQDRKRIISFIKESKLVSDGLLLCDYSKEVMLRYIELLHIDKLSNSQRLKDAFSFYSDGQIKNFEIDHSSDYSYNKEMINVKIRENNEIISALIQYFYSSPNFDLKIGVERKNNKFVGFYQTRIKNLNNEEVKEDTYLLFLEKICNDILKFIKLPSVKQIASIQREFENTDEAIINSQIYVKTGVLIGDKHVLR